ncbi:MAG TPA: acetyl-CoA carboxylase biotin carboxyl carrier protein [Candidatus Faecalibacterium avium]|uniref:acetyl-CoA carboxylase biotin carboxyl carrier protein n=1 Tax=unclassified Faecalibacterium TaxID=2646395 RepID=UPI000B36A1F0|nr:MULTISPECIES: acetyl-CoA carboxylase biotin carboxyl carrier protein [unclassified Faecalibacterium]OUN75728.1 acetyl-CoA carboxylase, biotin carboxyl carrier protein [Faecalibacterium sp. An58]OUQ38359.1 acetyl-CoA carboxylase, biotin carboxyl carrier protein [Faecalibacterium sp. An121]HIV44282.1 acetyl-CoA carboxylase biotin carboxyl carrier protein [Candidatus Faecalibacterium avium]
MTNQEIMELMARFDASSLTSFKLHTKDTELEMGKGAVAVTATAPAAPAAAPVPSPAPVPAAAPAVEEGLYITAPVVGTFYVAPSPDQPPFVQVGDKVQKGQTVCLMEAMKMMNEVKAPCDCIIEAVLQQDGALVSFGDQLIRYREG